MQSGLFSNVNTVPKFRLALRKDETDAMIYASTSEDHFVVSHKTKRVDVNLKGNVLVQIEGLRFNGVSIKQYGKKTLSFQTKSYSRILDNGHTKLGFNLI